MSDSTLIFFIAIILYLLVTWKAGEVYPILYLFLFTYFLQYIFSTYLMYNVYHETGIRMAIRQGPYFEYAIPALLSLFAGVLVFNRDLPIRDLLREIDSRQASQMGYVLLVISYSFDILSASGFDIFNSIVSFTQYLKYVAVFCFLFTNSWFKYFLGVLVYLQLAVIVLRGGVFIDFINWSTYLFFFVALKFRLPFALRAGFIVVAMPVLILIQTVKDDYRKATWTNKHEAGFDLFTELAQKKKEKEIDAPFPEQEGVVNTIARLNEGWHLGLTLNHVPKKQPIADGEEMIGDIVSSILPRVLFSDKKIVHTKEKFYQYTGRKLLGSTSMTIGLLGDFYINYGTMGSFIMLFIFGGLIARLVHYFLKRFVLPDPINIVWIPFMLSYLIRADDDFYIIFNCLVKGFLIFFAVNYLRYKVFNAKKPVYTVSELPRH